MFKNILRCLKVAMDLVVVIFSSDYLYHSADSDYHGKCPNCKLDHSQKNLQRYSTMGGVCQFLGIFDTDIKVFKTRCSSDECAKNIRWYVNNGEEKNILAF